MRAREDFAEILCQDRHLQDAIERFRVSAVPLIERIATPEKPDVTPVLATGMIGRLEAVTTGLTGAA